MDNKKLEKAAPKLFEHLEIVCSRIVRMNKLKPNLLNENDKVVFAETIEFLERLKQEKQ